MPPKAESKYISFTEHIKPMNIDTILACTCSFLVISGIIAYFVAEYYQHT
jgi:hypothetical protein